VIQAVLLFLVAILAVGVFGKLRNLRVPPPGRKPTLKTALKCATCGDYVVAAKPGSCGRPDCPYPPARS
jgi:hypothetical protein